MTSPRTAVTAIEPPAVVGQVMSSDFVPSHARTADCATVHRVYAPNPVVDDQSEASVSMLAALADTRLPATDGSRWVTRIRFCGFTFG